jgi:hypothetical protein
MCCLLRQLSAAGKAMAATWSEMTVVRQVERLNFRCPNQYGPVTNKLCLRGPGRGVKQHCCLILALLFSCLLLSVLFGPIFQMMLGGLSQ